MNKKEELTRLLTDLGEDINDRMENLIAIKARSSAMLLASVLAFIV